MKVTFNKIFALVFGLTGAGAIWSVIVLGAWWQLFIALICVIMVVVLIKEDRKK